MLVGGCPPPTFQEGQEERPQSRTGPAPTSAPATNPEGLGASDSAQREAAGRCGQREAPAPTRSCSAALRTPGCHGLSSGANIYFTKPTGSPTAQHCVRGASRSAWRKAPGLFLAQGYKPGRLGATGRVRLERGERGDNRPGMRSLWTQNITVCTRVCTCQCYFPRPTHT